MAGENGKKLQTTLGIAVSVSVVIGAIAVFIAWLSGAKYDATQDARVAVIQRDQSEDHDALIEHISRDEEVTRRLESTIGRVETALGSLEQKIDRL